MKTVAKKKKLEAMEVPVPLEENFFAGAFSPLQKRRHEWKRRVKGVNDEN